MRRFSGGQPLPFDISVDSSRVSSGGYLLTRALTKPLLVSAAAPHIAAELAAAFLPVVFEHIRVSLKSAAPDSLPCAGQDARIRYSTSAGRTGVLAFMPVEDGAVVRSLEEQYAQEQVKRDFEERQNALRSSVDAISGQSREGGTKEASTRERAMAAAARLARAKAEGRYPPPPAIRPLHSFVMIDFLDSRSWASERNDEEEQTVRPLTPREFGLKTPLLRTTDFAEVPAFASAITRICAPLVPAPALLDDVDAWCSVSLDAHVPALRGSRRLRQWLQLMAHTRICADGKVLLPESLHDDLLFTDLAARAEEAVASGLATSGEREDFEPDAEDLAIAEAAAQRREKLSERREQIRQGRVVTRGRGRSRGGR